VVGAIPVCRAVTIMTLTARGTMRGQNLSSYPVG